MTVEELQAALDMFDGALEVYFPNTHNPCGTINPVDVVEANTHGFFGKSVPCVILSSGGPMEKETP